MTELEETRKVLAETTFKLTRVEKALDFIIQNNSNMKMPSKQDMLDINIQAMEEVSIYVPWAKWVEADPSPKKETEVNIFFKSI